MHGSRVTLVILIAAGAVVLATAVLLRPSSGPASAGLSMIRPGDVSCDGFVDPIDAALILQLDARLIAALPCPANGDTDEDGSVGPIDAALILQFAAGLIDSLPPPQPPAPTSTPGPAPTPTRTPSSPPGSTPTPLPTGSPTTTPTPTMCPPQGCPTPTVTPTPTVCPPQGCPTPTVTPTPTACPPGGCPTPPVPPTPTGRPSPTPTPSPTACPPQGCPTPPSPPTPTTTPTPTLCEPGFCFVDFSIGIDVDGDTTDDCSTKEGGSGKCSLGHRTDFTVSVYLNDLGSAPSYQALEIYFQYTGVDSMDNPDLKSHWPDCVFWAPGPGPDFISVACVIGVDAPPSTYTGRIATNGFNCAGDGSIAVVHGAGKTSLTDHASNVQIDDDVTETLTVNCR